MIDYGEKKIEGKLEGYNDFISSDKIVSFLYQSYAFQVECNKYNNDRLEIKVYGGLYEERDGRAFRLNYTSKNINIMKKLQKIVDDYKIAYNNGSYIEISGLPNEFGDTICITYETGEQIYKSSNFINVIPQMIIKEIYDIFHEDAIKNGLDFTNEKSNEIIFDDATDFYLQGEWEGYHFGKKYQVFFSGTNIKIFCDRILVEDCEYIIIRGNVRKNKKKDGITIPSSEYDFEELNGVSYFKKKNDYVLNAYYKEDNYLIEEFKRVYE